MAVRPRIHTLFSGDRSFHGKSSYFMHTHWRTMPDSMTKRRPFFYNDAPEWGGQEVLSAGIANILAENSLWNISFFYFCPQFDKTLSPAIHRITLHYKSSTPFPILRDRNPLKIRRAKKLLIRHKVSHLVVCPGNIERGLPAIYAAKSLGLTITSYIPMGYTQKETHAKFGEMRDVLAKRIYPLVDQWITVSKVQENLLRLHLSPETPVHLIPNPLDSDLSLPPKQPKIPLHIATIGRLYFPLKGQDEIPPLASAIQETMPGARFSIIGEGPHRHKLEALIKKNKIADAVEILPWMTHEKLEKLLIEKYDVLFIPSHFESGPIVLFEALQCSIPVLIADAEYIKEYDLPPWMIYSRKNPEDALHKLENLSAKWNPEKFSETRTRLFKNRSEASFRHAIHEVFNDVWKNFEKTSTRPQKCPKS